jgi:hypothetical protein
MADLARIKENVAKMAGMNAPEADIDGYIASEGVSINDVRDFQPQSTFSSRIQADFQKRKDAMNQSAEDYVGGKQGLASTYLQTAGELGGGIWDVGINTAKTAYDALPDAIKPKLTDDGRAALETVKQGIGNAINYVSDSAVGDVARQNPVFMKNVGALGNIASVVPVGAAAKIVGKPLLNAGVKSATVASDVTKAAAKTLVPNISEGMADIASLAQKYEIPLSLDQVSGSRALKTIQKAGQDLPFSGQQAFREKQLLSLQKQLFKTVGVDADRFNTATMAKAFEKVGGEFDSLTKGKQFNIGGEFINNAAQTAEEVASTYGKDAAEIYGREALKVIDDFGSGDSISGELISRQRARINGLARKASDPNIKGALLDLENNIVDGITSGDPVLQNALSQAKNRYKNLIVLEPIANKAKGGFISPALLNNRVSQVYKRAHTIGQSGEIGDLARIGSELLPELGGSDTAQKLFLMGASVPTGFIAPTTTAVTLGANKAFQSGVNRNQALVGKAIEKAQAAKITKQDLQKALEARKQKTIKAPSNQ